MYFMYFKKNIDFKFTLIRCERYNELTSMALKG